MNRLLEILKREGRPTAERLKQIYRQLCKKTHPDTENGTHEEFIQLRREYEEALTAVMKGRVPAERKTLTSSEAREIFLEKLYLFSMRLFGSDGEQTLNELIGAAGDYRKDVQILWTDYQKSFYQTRKQWADSGEVFYAHNLLIMSIKQLFYYFSLSRERYRTLLFNYLADLREKYSKKLDAERTELLKRMAVWLQEEADGEKTALF